MNLTIEQMREIVSGAPEWALAWCPETDPSHPYTDASEGICGFCVEIKDLRAAIADHDRTDYVSDIANHIAPTTRVIKG